jgi:hypothetical protein
MQQNEKELAAHQKNGPPVGKYCFWIFPDGTATRFGITEFEICDWKVNNKEL